MAGYAEDPSKWRLKTPQKGIPYKVKGMEGGFAHDGADIDFNVLVPSNRLQEFILETFPPPIKVGNVTIPQYTTLPGLPGLGAKKLTFRSLDDELPIDPFNGDTGLNSTSHSKTYFGIVELTVTYSPAKQPDPNNPFTFLEISSNATGEFLYAVSGKAKHQSETNPNLGEDGDDEDPENPANNQNNDEPRDGENPTPGDKVPVKRPTTAALATVPMTEWTVRWPQVPFKFYSDVLIHRMRACMGRVNDRRVPLLFNAAPETLLFVAHNYEQALTWRDGKTNTPPVNVTMKVVEKRVHWNGVVMGHNHVWTPDQGWQRIVMGDNEHKIYKKWDMNRLFLI